MLRTSKSKVIIAILAIIILYANAVFADDYVKNEAVVDFSYLRDKLTAEGIDPEITERYLKDSRFGVIPELLKVNINQPSASASYQRFLSPQSVQETSAFLSQNKDVFDRILQDSRVDAEVVAAILQVESSLGNNKGKFPLFNVFASLTLLDTDQLETAAPDFWEISLKGIEPAELSSIRSKIIKRAEKKAEWAYKELLSLMEMGEKFGGEFDPFEIRGSWAGAFGLPQFLPSSVKNYGRDGDGDELVNICQLEDAIASIANYLESHGYRSDNPRKRRKAVWHYNHSYEYVDCVIELAEKVK